jgi:hypothetical protein
MIEFTEDTVNQRCVCKSDKFVENIIIKKARDGFVFFEVAFENGSVPNDLRGKYTSMRSAMKAVVTYVANAKESRASRTQYFNEQREKRKQRNAAEDQPKGSEHLREGPDH